MADPRDGASDGSTAKSSSRERPPELVRLEIASWEHAACKIGSWGRADRVTDLQRLLPYELTAPIYTMMARAEALFQRRTEPLPPLKERLARDFLDGDNDVRAADTIGDFTDGWSLEKELGRIFGGIRLGDVVPGWDKKMVAALGVNAEGITNSIRDFARLGLPREEFLVSYGYQLHVFRIKGNMLSPQILTHDALLMGFDVPVFQPGPLRENMDKIFDDHAVER